LWGDFWDFFSGEDDREALEGEAAGVVLGVRFGVVGEPFDFLDDDLAKSAGRTMGGKRKKTARS